ncbi:MAG: transporter substrate-binding domain-containing protein [Clostridia bacterium]|nr:transporter substrate-binding domain-containing protein [Clostridia bacterium]
MSKKIIAVVLAVIVAVIGFVFVGCNKDSGETTTAPSDSSSASEEANADWDAIKESGNLVVGITEYEPMDFQDENGEWTGFDAEYAKAVAEKLGLTVKFVEVDWDNKEMELSSKKVDCLWNGMTITDELKKSMDISDAYVINAQVIVMKADAIEKYKTTDDMKDLTFAVEAGSAGASAAKDAGLKTKEVDLQTTALTEVKAGTSDACVIDITMAKAMVGEGTSYADLAVGTSLTEEEYGVGCRQGSALVSKINEATKELAADGTMKKLAEKYNLSLAF